MTRSIDVSVGDVSDAYAGAVGTLWEMVMGEQIHVGGPHATTELATTAGIERGCRVLDICSALGGPARQLARDFGCRVTGIDATPAMVEEATRRTAAAGLAERVAFRLGNALDLPFKASSFDLVWGQDAWCYVTDRERLVREAGRVARPGGTLAFTDWIAGDGVPDEELVPLLGFMLFPSLETRAGYTRLLRENGWRVTRDLDLGDDFALQLARYHGTIRGELGPEITRRFGEGFFEAVDKGIGCWERAAREGTVGRGLWVATKSVG